jgi:hypothetical protein
VNVGRRRSTAGIDETSQCSLEAMSGLEAAGLALGALPVLIAAIGMLVLANKTVPLTTSRSIQ